MSEAKIPLSQIAAALGVSRTTVCRALSGKGRVNPETARRVREYLLARKADAAGHTGLLALVLSPQIPPPLLQAVCAAAARDGRGLLLLPCTAPKTLLKQVLRQQIVGVLLPQHPQQREWAAALQAEGVPYVLLGGAPQPELPQATVDPAAALRELDLLLRAKGLCRTVLLAREPHSGLCSAWRQVAGLDALVYEMPEDGLEHTLEQALDTAPDCLLFDVPSSAQNALYLLRGKGIAVPQQLAVVSLRDAPALAGGELTVTALHWDEAALAAAAVHRLAEQRQMTPPACQLILRDSTRR